MKRSEVNVLIQQAHDFFTGQNFRLPPFADWAPADWARRSGGDTAEIRQASLGWDITDFGSGDFYRIGLILFTIRNGIPGLPQSKTYCEKIMMVREDQVTPLHFHSQKTEDIINRAGGRLALRFYWADENERLNQDKPVTICTDGLPRTLKPGEILLLEPGQSVTIPPRLYHDFWALKGSGPVMAGEVSSVNDDKTDNRFLLPAGRFPQIQEDVEAKFVLCGEYPAD